MRYLLAVLVLLLSFGTAVFAEAPPEAAVQGLYVGSGKSAGSEHQIEARVVAIGKGKYKVLLRQPGADGKVEKIELALVTDAEALRITGKGKEAAWAGDYAHSVIKGKSGPEGTFELKRVVRESPTLGVRPPAGAIVLLDGKNFDEMPVGKPVGAPKEPAAEKPPGDKPAAPQVKVGEDGSITVPAGGMSSKRSIPGDFKLHVEFKNPLMPEATGQGRGNSGVYLPNGDEIQVLDSFGMTTYVGGGCGGLYNYKDPDVFDEFSLTSAPPLQWQTYDIEYRVIKPQDGKGDAKARVTVLHNGIKIHDNAELKKPAKPGRFNFQDHGNQVQYRNIWVVPAGEK